MELLSRLSFLVAIRIVVYFQCVCTSGTAITAAACATDTDCTGANAVCNNKTHCACKDAFKEDTGADCVAKVLNDTCSKAEDCVNVKNATCASKKCQCSVSFKVNGAVCAKKVLNDTCSKADECVNAGNATCDSTTHKCKCAVGFKANDAVCARRVVSDPCTDQKECPLNADCDATTKKCTCSSGFSASNGLCAKVLGASCSDTNKTAVCGPSVTIGCVSGHCACLHNSYVEENNACKAAVGTTCTKATDCVSNSDCDKAKHKCICSTGYVNVNGKCSSQSSADSVKMTINAIVVSFLCAALWNFV